MLFQNSFHFIIFNFKKIKLFGLFQQGPFTLLVKKNTFCLFSKKSIRKFHWTEYGLELTVLLVCVYRASHIGRDRTFLRASGSVCDKRQGKGEGEGSNLPALCTFTFLPSAN